MPEVEPQPARTHSPRDSASKPSSSPLPPLPPLPSPSPLPSRTVIVACFCAWQERTLHALREHGAEHKVRDVKNAKRRDYSQMQQAARDELRLQNSSAWQHRHSQFRASDGSSVGSSAGSDLEHGGGGGDGEHSFSVLVPRRLAVGARVRHDTRGPGTVTRHDRTHGHPLKIFVVFDSGETHGYKQESWPKLHEAEGSGAGSGAEGTVLQGITHLTDGTIFHGLSGAHGHGHGHGHGGSYGHGCSYGHAYGSRRALLHGGAAERSNRHMV